VIVVGREIGDDEVQQRLRALLGFRDGVHKAAA
jgi:hypothetical protein